MEKKILKSVTAVCKSLAIPVPQDGRLKLAVNNKGKKWKIRSAKNLKGMVWHQELGWGRVESVARYHTSKNSHLCRGGTESIAYTWAIRRNGQIVLCNNFNKATWSQGYRGRKGDENAEFMSVMYEGFFKADGINDATAEEPNCLQMLSGLVLWHICKGQWVWGEDDLYGHYAFGKPACPGDTLRAIVDAVRINAPRRIEYKMYSVKGRQKALKKLGFYTGKIDGLWGPQSRGALILYQSKHKLSADGIWGPKTEAKVLAALK